jgi:hypothetical protein
LKESDIPSSEAAIPGAVKNKNGILDRNRGSTFMLDQHLGTANILA